MGTVMFAMTPRTDTATKTRGRINYSSPAPREQPSLLPIITRGRRRGVRRGCSKRSHFFFPSQTIPMENYRVFFFISSRRTETKCGEALSWGFMWLYISKDAAGNLSTNLTQKKNLLLPTTYSLVLCVQSLIYCADIWMCHTDALWNRLLYVHECGHWSLFWVHHTLPTPSACHEFSPQLYKMCINPQMEIVQSKPCGPLLHVLRKISLVWDFSWDLFTAAKLEHRLRTCNVSWLHPAQMWRFISDKVCSVLYIQLSEFTGSINPSAALMSERAGLFTEGRWYMIDWFTCSQSKTTHSSRCSDTMQHGCLSQFNQVCWQQL